MSDYVFKRVLRVPTEKYGINSYRLSENPQYKHLFDHYPQRVTGCFSPAPTVTNYLDFVLAYNDTTASGNYGRARLLTEAEKAKFAPVFRAVIPNINMDDVHLVEFCWYNCTEAPDYYDEINIIIDTVGKTGVHPEDVRKAMELVRRLRSSENQ